MLTQNDLLYIAFTSSVLAWFFLGYRFRGTGRILAFEDREKTVWGPLGLLACCFHALATIEATFQQDTVPSLSVSGLARFSAFQIAIVLLSQAWLKYTHGVSYRALGWPKNIIQGLFDARIGIVLVVAAIGPVYAILALLAQANKTNTHPFIDMFQNNPSPALVGNILLAAIVVAPLFEEILFRQLAQGWLEKIETWWLAQKAIQNSGYKEELSESSEEKALLELKCNSLVFRFRGWIPILISSLLFSAVHIGQGSAPIPLFLFAVMLGYVYHKTHRILPCIIAHMIFNLFAMLSLYVELTSK